MRCLCPAGWIQVSFGLNQICLHSGKYVNRFREGKDDSNGVAHERKTKRPVPPRWGSVGYAAQRSGLFQPIWPKHHCCSGWFTPCWNAFNRDLSTFYGQHRWFSVKSSIWEFFSGNSGASLLVQDLHHTREAMNAGKSICVQNTSPTINLCSTQCALLKMYF